MHLDFLCKKICKLIVLAESNMDMYTFKDSTCMQVACTTKWNCKRLARKGWGGNVFKSLLYRIAIHEPLLDV